MPAIEWMNQLAEAWASVMWIRVLDSACVFLLIGTLWLIVRKWAPAQFGYYLFLLVLVKLILPAPVSVPGLFNYLFPGEPTQESLVRMNWAFPFPLDGGVGAEENTVATQESMTPAASQTGPEISLFSLLMLVWGIGAFFFFLYHVIVEWKTSFMMRNTIPLEPNQLPVNVHELQRQAGIKRKVHWVTGYWVKSPVAYGLFHPKIAVPMEMARNYSERQIRWILLHELAHIKRGDTLVFLFQRLLQSLFFFNPLIWWVNALIDRLREYACDDAALVESQTLPKECGEGFLGVVMQNNGLPTFQYATHGLINYKTMIRRRLMRILDDKRRLYAKLTFGAMILLLMVTLFVAPFSFKVAVAQVSGWELVADTGPSSRAWPVMVYDSYNRVVLMHGGVGEFPEIPNLNDTWEWDGETWTQVSMEGPARYGSCMAYDFERNVAVLFGGLYTTESANNNPVDSDTWEWDSKNRKWKQIDTTREMGYLSETAMVYDPVRKIVVLHGGSRYGAIQSKTMAWDGKHWFEIAEGPERLGHSLVYDSVRNKIILFGGFADFPGEFPAEATWEFDGVSWTHIPTSIEPPGRVWSAYAFDSIRGIMAVFGGGIYHLNPRFGFSETFSYQDTWEWNGEQWLEIDGANPPPRFAAKMAFDPQRQKMVLFGGTPDGVSGYTGTWEYTAPSSSGIPKSLWSLY